MTNLDLKNCRLCGTLLSAVPIIKLENVPSGGQAFPTLEKLNEDFAASLDVYQCSSCGLVQLGGEPVVYTDQLTSPSAHSPKMLEHRRRQAQNLVKNFDLKGKKVIEVGCGDGYFMELLAEIGTEAFGIEPSTKSAELGNQRGLKIQVGQINKNSVVEYAPFDAFVTMHVLEHTPDPNEFLQAIHEKLNEDAVGLIEVPSFEKALELHRFYDFVADHLSYFTVKTLKLAVEKNGFEVLQIERNWDGEHIVATVQRREQNSLNFLSKSLDKLSKQMILFINSYVSVGKRVAIWGASTHGVTLLSLTRPKGLAYVVDSSPHKQGRFTPAFNLPIVPPNRLIEDPVDAIIVTAPRFSDVIIHKLRTDINFSGTVAVICGEQLEVVK